MTVILREAVTPAEITACFPVMHALRPNLASAEEMVARVLRQRDGGFRLLAAWRDNTAVALAGWREQENLMHGRFLYVDDLVTAETERGGGLGARLLAHLADHARAEGIKRLVLDTALANVRAHRFYYRTGLAAGALRFYQTID